MQLITTIAAIKHALTQFTERMHALCIRLGLPDGVAVT